MRTFAIKPGGSPDRASRSSQVSRPAPREAQSEHQEIQAEPAPLNAPRFQYEFAGIPVEHRTRSTTATNLKIGRSDDRYEQEAERMANSVMRTPQPTATAAPALSPAPSSVIQRCSCGGTCAKCRKQEPEDGHEHVLRRKALHADRGEPQSAPPIVHQALRSPGQPLDTDTRTFMEQRFGYDFSKVRLHADATAFESASAVHALAHTIGRDIVFASGSYSPGTRAGRQLLAHELSHVVQQQPLPAIPAPQSASEPGHLNSATSTPARLSRVSTPMLSRQTDTRTMPAKDGGTDSVTRVITPAKCNLGPHLFTNVSKDISASNAFLEIDLCRGSVSGEIRGDVDYGDALKTAGQAVAKMLNSVSSGQPSAQAMSTLANDLKQLKPDAKITLNLQASDVFRLDITGLGTATPGGTVTGQATARAEFDVGPVKLSLEGTVSGGNQEKTSYQITGNVGLGGSRLEKPNCQKCICGKPDIKFACSHIPPRGNNPPPPAPKSATPRYVPYFFPYSCATPSPERNKQNLAEAVRWIRQDYTIARVEGNASPEGPVEGMRHGKCKFENNTKLAQARAEEAKKQLDAELRASMSNDLIMRPEVYQHALSASYPVVGRGELFGSDEKGEVPESRLLPHLESTLAPPKEGHPDVLAQEHIAGEGLSSSAQAGAEADIATFRNKKLAKQKRLEALYGELRRALIVLNPPPPPPPNLRLSQHQVENVIGTSIDCTPAHRALFKDVPIDQDKLFEGDCRPAGSKASGSGSTAGSGAK